MTAYLVLADGSVYEGKARGAFHETVCDWMVCNSMSGHLEALTDPASAGCGLLLSYPMAGNAGVNKADFESERIWASALIVNELCAHPSNFRSEGTMEETLLAFDIPCLCDVDTRSIVKKLREVGVMRGMLTADVSDMAQIQQKIAERSEKRSVEAVSTPEMRALETEHTGFSVALLDLGAKRSLIEALTQRGGRVTLYPWNTPAQDILAGGHDGILVSGGPGAPVLYADLEAQLKTLLESGLPLLAVGLGHLLLAGAAGAQLEALQNIHCGGNYPVRFLAEDRTYLTAQAAAYAVMREGLPQGVSVLCENVNDQSVEGLRYNGKACSVAFRPEGAPGPADTLFLLDKFVCDMKKEEAACHA